MPQVSRRKLPKKTEKELMENLNLVFSAIKKKEEMVIFLSTFVTDTEKLMLAKRLSVIILISEGLSDRQIASSLNMTRITVAKLRYFYEARGQEGYALVLSIIAADKQLQQFKKILLSLARYTARAAGGYVKPTIFD